MIGQTNKQTPKQRLQLYIYIYEHQLETFPEFMSVDLKNFGPNRFERFNIYWNKKTNS